jgi:hypothetical protein
MTVAMRPQLNVTAKTVAQLFNFQWLARPVARWLFLLFTYGSHCRLFINQPFFEQCRRSVVLVAPRSLEPCPIPNSRDETCRQACASHTRGWASTRGSSSATMPPRRVGNDIGTEKIDHLYAAQGRLRRGVRHDAGIMSSLSSHNGRDDAVACHR